MLRWLGRARYKTYFLPAHLLWLLQTMDVVWSVFSSNHTSQVHQLLCTQDPKRENNKALFFTVNNNNKYRLKLYHLPFIKGQCFMAIISFWTSRDGHNKREKNIQKKAINRRILTRHNLVCIYLVIFINYSLKSVIYR